MPFSEQRKKELFEVLERTARRSPIAGLPAYPQEYQDYRKLCEEEVLTRTVDGYPYTLYMHRAKSRTENCPIHIYIHGGGFVYPHADCDSMFSSYLADRIGGIVVDLDYTTSGTAPWPVAFDQCYDAARYTFAQCADWGGDENRISAGGYSAGGTLVAGMALKAADTGDFRLCLQVLGYPLLDSVNSPVYKKGAYPRILPLDRELAFSELYFRGDTEAAASVYSSPCYAADEQLKKLPRTLILSAEGCNFRFENEEYAGRLASVGVEVTVKRFLDTCHGFIPHFGNHWRAAAELIARRIGSAKN